MRISSNRVKFLGQLKLACAIPLALPSLSSMVRSLHSPPEGYWRASVWVHWLKLRNSLFETVNLCNCLQPILLSVAESWRLKTGGRLRNFAASSCAVWECLIDSWWWCSGWPGWEGRFQAAQVERDGSLAEIEQLAELSWSDRGPNHAGPSLDPGAQMPVALSFPSISFDEPQ